ncbi:VPS10 domain-containing protein [Kordiimonas laminariae]|uniref:VPS10 domain-containing protein n=1 Tax=Kordiimonas laminariae TaxID=2917717 RepID=UPI001FF6B875|nr:glycosyl hydrolase [Kordiimonas laminariae]MCK0070616.1 glycosyl hydrolase [Kordiimonas laminariae]
MKLGINLGLALMMATSPLLAADDDLMSAKTFAGMKVRNIGPAYMSGRVSDIAVDQTDPSTWYVAMGSGGVWKTVNAGTTWKPIFDDQDVYSIGDVTIDPSNPNIIWVGTGENNGGRHISFGDGVYKSLDGGKTWKNMGLKASEHIGDIVIHPTDSNTVWVSAQGPLWSKGGERGVYKTTDGGKTWRNVLEGDEWTGVGTLAIDPSNPDKLYAAKWQRQRTVAALIDTGPGSGLFTSDDGGETWVKMKTGLPGGDLGKSSIAVSPIDPNVVYAAIETNGRKGGFWRSSDKGASWKKMSDIVGGGTGPHYYQEIFVDPDTFDMVYMSSNVSSFSMDGGKTWKNVNLKNRHVDDHAFAFHPTDPDFILVGSDGGLYESRDNMATWRFMEGIPVTQFYKIAADDDYPFYNVYGGTQDNSTQGGPSRTRREDGIKNSDWYLIMGGDGHQPATEPGNPDIVYAQWQQGNLNRYDRKTRETIYIQPQGKPGDPAERFNWDAPINVSHHDPKRLYHASQRLWRSDDRGDSWTAISPDLTRNENRLHIPMMDRKWGAEAGWDLYAMSNYNTIANVAESPVDENILYVGTDDGLIQATSDGGENWTRYEIGKIKGVPARAYVNDIRADRFDADTVYAALDNHKEGDYKPYLIKSTNRGKSWKMITGGLPEKNLVWRITQDHVNKDLMFIGTEFGLYFTVDGGSNWVELTGGVPTISFRDVRIQRRENDLVAGSFGRGIFILDDYSALRGLNNDTLDQEALLFAKDKTLLFNEDGLHSDNQGANQWVADNPPYGATFTYYLKDTFKTSKQKRVAADKKLAKDGKDVLFPAWDVLEAELREAKPKVFVTIKDASGKVIRHVAAANKKGVQRVTWDLHHAAQEAITYAASSSRAKNANGVKAIPGTYTATLNVRENGNIRQLAQPVSFEVVADVAPTLQKASAAEVQAFQQKVSKAGAAVRAASAVISDLQKQLKVYRVAMDRTADQAALETQYEAIRAELFSLAELLNGKKADDRKGAEPETISSRIGFAQFNSGSSYGPTPQSHEQMGYALEAFRDVRRRLGIMTEQTIPAFEKALEDAGAPWVRGSMKLPSAE